jgi:hypothetical protein
MTTMDQLLAAPMTGQAHALPVAAGRWARLTSAPDYNRPVLVQAPVPDAGQHDLDDLLAAAEQVPGDMHAEDTQEQTLERQEAVALLDASQNEVMYGAGD